MAALDHTVTVELPPVEALEGGRPGQPRILKIAGNGPGVRNQFVRIIKDRAWRELDSQAVRMPVSRYNRLETALAIAMGAGKYEWDDEIHNSIEGTRAGFTALLLARLRVGTGDENLHETVVTELLDKFGYERLSLLTKQADGPDLPKDKAPDPPNGSS